jgi:membrane-associated protease RseP (regulator of RpoE activity)
VDYLKYSKPGDQVRIEYERNGKRNVATATLGEPQNLENMIAKGLNNLNNVNINVSQKEACLGVYTDNGREADMAGARIDAFTKESAAKEVKMEENDLILSLNGTRIENSNDLWNEIAKFKAGETVDVEYLRGNRKETVKTTLKACRNSSSLVTIEKKDEKGNVQSRQFKTWSWGEKEKQQMQNQRIIAIRKGEGDGQQVKITPEQLVAPNRNLTLEQFRAYPNPSSGPVTVEFKSAAVATVVSLFDLSGRQLFREELNAFDGTYMQQFDLTDYAKGTILVHIQQGEKIYTEQIVVN